MINETIKKNNDYIVNKMAGAIRKYLPGAAAISDAFTQGTFKPVSDYYKGLVPDPSKLIETDADGTKKINTEQLKKTIRFATSFQMGTVDVSTPAQKAMTAQKTLYHGTNADFKSFSPNDKGIFFTEDKGIASGYKGANKVVAAKLNIKKPFNATEKNLKPIFESQGYTGSSLQDKIEEYYTGLSDVRADVMHYAKSEGFDSIIIPRDEMGLSKITKSYVVFDPKNIELK